MGTQNWGITSYLKLLIKLTKRFLPTFSLIFHVPREFNTQVDILANEATIIPQGEAFNKNRGQHLCRIP
jgi:hypothetical protein